MAMIRKCVKCGSEVYGRYSVILDTMEYLCGMCGYECRGKPLDQITDDDAAANRTQSDV